MSEKQTCETAREYPFFGYAPGNYMNFCFNCRQQFEGDKRAVRCEPCAEFMAAEVSRLESLILKCETCKWWREIKVHPALPKSDPNRNGNCMNPMNDVLNWNISHGAAIRQTMRAFADHTCCDHAPLPQQGGKGE